MALSVQPTQYAGRPALQVEDEALRLVILPELGAKVVSLVLKRTGREYLWRHPERPLRPATYDDDFTAGYLGGWDECFPTIGAGVYPEAPWAGVGLPDHGELWALPWHYAQQGDQLRMWVHSPRFAYTFERTFQFLGAAGLSIAYRVTNPTPFALRALWSLHPFLSVTPATRVLLPAGLRVRVELSQGQRLGGFLSEHNWPVATDVAGQAVDLSLMGPLDTRWMEKLFTTPLPEGWAGFHDGEDDHYLLFTFAPAEVPFVGLALMRGGWPATGAPVYSLILEPCTGWPDRLDIAIPRGAAMTIPAQGERAWSLDLRLGVGPVWSQMAARAAQPE
ncbi:MAG: hypothetical protein IT317_03645 [Anaerolineales bacterium]|nr:hypothetical protein [Anaerolineales bacterium]